MDNVCPKCFGSLTWTERPAWLPGDTEAPRYLVCGPCNLVLAWLSANGVAVEPDTGMPTSRFHAPDVADPCPTCGRPSNPDGCGRYMRVLIGAMTSDAHWFNCERAGRLRAEAALTRIAARLAWSREWWDGDLAGEVIGIMDRDGATIERVRALLDVAYAACNDAYPCYDKVVVDAVEEALLACGAKMVVV